MTTLFTNSLWQRIVVNASRHPMRTVLKDTNGNERTYRDFVDRVNQFAGVLQRNGVAKGDRVLFLERPSIRGIEIFFALYRVGAIAVIADPAMGRENFKSRIEFSKAQLVVMDPTLAFLRKIPGAMTLVRALHPSIPDIHITLPRVLVMPRKPSLVPHVEEITIEDAEDALIIFTSGTTSTPKGVVHTFASLRATIELLETRIEKSEHDVFLSSQLHFSIIALMRSATAIINSNTIFSPTRFYDQCVTLQPTHTFLLPKEGQLIIDVLKKRNVRLPSTLKTIMFGSAPVLLGFLERFATITDASTQILAIYGATEILPVSVATFAEKHAYTGMGDYLGTLLSGVTVDVQDGELLIRGPHLAQRYLHEDTPLTFFASGDLGELLPNNALVLTGRKKDMIIKDHHNVYPAIFESTVSKIAGVKNCALVGVYNDAKQDEDIFLCVEKEDDAPPDQEFTAYVNRELRSGPWSIDSYALPDKIFVMELPLSGRSQKIDKAALRTLCKARL